MDCNKIYYFGCFFFLILCTHAQQRVEWLYCLSICLSTQQRAGWANLEHLQPFLAKYATHTSQTRVAQRAVKSKGFCSLSKLPNITTPTFQLFNVGVHDVSRFSTVHIQRFCNQHTGKVLYWSPLVYGDISHMANTLCVQYLMCTVSRACVTHWRTTRRPPHWVLSARSPLWAARGTPSHTIWWEKEKTNIATGFAEEAVTSCSNVQAVTVLILQTHCS